MAVEKVSIALEADLAAEARRQAGPRGLSRLVNAAVRQYLQTGRLQEFEEELTKHLGVTQLNMKRPLVMLHFAV